MGTLTALTLLFAIFRFSECTPLDDYVNRLDLTYNYDVMSRWEREGYTVHNINLTSQTWKTENRTSHPLWWHYLQIVEPESLDITINTAFLYMGLGTQNDVEPPPESDQRLNELIKFARSANCITVYMRQVPNQPIWFTEDDSGRGRSEDDAMAFPWRYYMTDQSDPEFLMWMPMTKAAVAAMDTVTLWSRANLTADIDQFVLSGASKRAWTVYLAAAVDNRVIAIVPQVLSLLNLQPNMHHHYRCLGGWTFAFGDYWAENLTSYLDSPAMSQSLTFLDPYSYRERLRMPKLMISGASDEFFAPDSNRFFFDELPGQNYILFLPNTGHTVRRSPRFEDMWRSMRNFFLRVIPPGPPILPEISWTIEDLDTEAVVTVTVIVEPLVVAGWVADSVSTVRRDFRLSVGFPPQPSGALWNNTAVQQINQFQYELRVSRPTTGWRAFFVEVQFAGMTGSEDIEDRLTITTDTRVIPDTLPFPDCQGAGCFGSLV